MARVCVLAFLARDARLTSDVLQKAGIHAESCSTNGPDALADAMKADCLIIAEELLTPDRIDALNNLLRNQPAWSDFPLIVLTLAGEVSPFTQKRREMRGPLGNVILLERPVRPETLISTVQNVLRA